MKYIVDEVVKKQMEILSGRKSFTKWTGSKFECVKDAACTPKGDFGERIFADILNKLGFTAEIVNCGKGEFDVLMKDSGLKIEVKTATEDTSKHFQFNGIKKDVNYDFVFCFGVSPSKLWFNFFPKSVCKNLTCAMTKDGGDSFKLTASPRSFKYPLHEFSAERFVKEVRKIV
ncbi:MAG: hypothetical protein HOM41_07700 [Flavobacteriales bacterium]|jgi:hypothetical protein|nr:hypothetical protein [Flavobacteriales bacterium]